MKRKAEGTLKEAINLKRKLAFESSQRAPTPFVGVGCKCDELKEEVKELKIELKKELKELKIELIKELKITIKETQQTHRDSLKKMIFSMFQHLLDKSNKRMVKDSKDVKVEEFEEENRKVDQNKEKTEVKVEEIEEEKSKVDQNEEKTEVKDSKDVKVEEFEEEKSKDEKIDIVDDVAVEDDEKMDVVDDVAVEDDEKMDVVDNLKVKVKDLKVKMNDEESVDVRKDVKVKDVMMQKVIESKKKKVEDDNDDFKLYNTPPKGKFGRRVRKPKKDESYINPSLSKLQRQMIK
ncbi:227 kDa spindle- and centromere-associated protein-like [Impatiens glandulifera]|uniref:227 kDa spindle- and centromere-associated protein-like n=1 Tax=Impatiens glandulifera TaxID=253017 RepID=UPI001FB07125|nr:227 kDa spindle- and centromere-associated protein-like [Impatiens glandulifera]